MKRTVRITLISIVITILAGYVIGSGIWLSKKGSETRCEMMHIRIQDSSERRYVSEQELINLLQREGIYPVGQPVLHVSTHRIERLIESHPMVHDAQVYMTTLNHLCIDLHQRRPLMRVTTASESYFVDSEHLVMPIRQSVTDPVIQATGNISQRMAVHELSTLAEWIQSDEYWQPRITTIHVRNPRYIELRQRGSSTAIILGDMTKFENKMHKLRKLYDGGFLQLDPQPNYRELDLRFDGQIVGRK